MKVQKKHHEIVASVITSLVILLAAGYFTFAYFSKQYWPFSQDTTVQTETSGINYSPPTQQELGNNQDGKKNSADPDISDTHEKTPVVVDIAFAGKNDTNTALDIRAFTPDVIEGSGSCTATLTHESKVVSATSKAFIDARSSICEPIEIPLNKLTLSNTWSLIVTYKSPTRSGASTAVNIEVSQ